MSWLKKYESEEPDYSNVKMSNGGPIWPKPAARQGSVLLPGESKPSTHLYSSGKSEGKHYAFPTLFQTPEGSWYQHADPFEHSLEIGEALEFDKAKNAKKYAKGAWKQEMAYGGWINKYEEGGGIDPIKGYKKEEPSSTATNIRPVVSSLEEGRKLAFKDAVNRSIQVAKQEQAAQKLQLQKDLYNQRAETNALTQAGKEVTDFGTSLATAPKRIASTVFTAITPDVINDTPQSYAQRVYDAATISDEDLWKGRIGTPLDKAGMIAEGASELALATMPLPSIKNIKTGAGMLADDIVNSPRLSMALQNPEKRLMNPEAYKTLTKESSGVRGKIADYYFKNKQKNIYSEIENIREKVYKARKMGQDDLADSYLDEISELQQKLLEEVIPQESQWRLNYSGLPITPAKMAGGQGTIYKNNINPEELIKVGSYMGDKESLNNLIKVGKNYKNPNVIAAFPTKAVPYKMGKENLQVAQFMPKLNYKETLPEITPEEIKNYLNEFDKMGVGVDYAGAGNIGSVDNKLGLVDLTYVGTPNNRNRHYFLREGVFNPVYRNNSGLERFQYDADDWVNLKNNKKQMGGWLNKYN